MRRLIRLVAAALIAASAAAAATTVAAIPDLGPVPMVRRDSPLPEDWARRGVFVEILVRAYQDSNGDGIGDLNGVTSRLDYLQRLGVRGIWLMPVFRSADRDHGYAVVNYREIEPDYGSLADFDRLLAEAHRRGIGVIVDYVMNHSASAHPLFESAQGSRASPYADWYLFSEDRPRGWNTFAGEPWRQGRQRWYYAVFDPGMPDFNLRNPAVVDFHLDNLRFWLNRGVDGFRFDAVGVLFENGAIAWENQPENHALLRHVRALLDEYGKRFMVCEAPGDPAAFAQPDSCGASFGFGLQKHIIASVKFARLRGDLLYTLEKLPVARLGTFLANHDFFAGARLMRQFAGDEPSYRLAAATLLTLPGTPFIYYGEEIGLGESAPVDHDDQAIRGPMAWSAAPHGGFTTAQRPFRPLVSNWKTHHVAAQEADAGSLLNWYRGLIALRNAEPALALGRFTALTQRDAPVLAFTREHEDATLLVLINYAPREVALSLPLAIDSSRWQPVFPAGAASPLSGPAGNLLAKMAARQVRVLKAVP